MPLAVTIFNQHPDLIIDSQNETASSSPINGLVTYCARFVADTLAFIITLTDTRDPKAKNRGSVSLNS